MNIIGALTILRMVPVASGLFRRVANSGIMVHQAWWVSNFMTFKDKHENWHFECLGYSDYPLADSGCPPGCSGEWPIPESWSIRHNGYQTSWISKTNTKFVILRSFGFNCYLLSNTYIFLYVWILKFSHANVTGTMKENWYIYLFIRAKLFKRILKWNLCRKEQSGGRNVPKMVIFLRIR